MKKTCLLIVVTIFGLLQLSCSKEDNPKKAWTILLYDDADFYNAGDPLDLFSQLVSSDSRINYLVLRDGNKTTVANYYRIGENHEKIMLKSLGEINMGDKSTIENFLSYAKEYFPAERYIVAFYDHGGGWKGTCWDMTSQDDNLTPAEINHAFSNNGGIDLVLFTAPCLMGSVESAYQLRNSARYYIGSEDMSGFIYWAGMLNEFDAFLKKNATISSNDLAREIVALHEQHKNIYGYGASITMSAIDLSKMSNLVVSLNKVTDYYIANTDKYKSMSHASLKKYLNDYCDLRGLLNSIKDNETESLPLEQITETISLLDECVIAECHGDSTVGSNGLNIYMPSNMYSSEIYYSPYGIELDFKSDCSWDNLLENYLDKTKSSADQQLKNIFRADGYTPIFN